MLGSYAFKALANCGNGTEKATQELASFIKRLMKKTQNGRALLRGLAIIAWWEARWGWTDTPEESIRLGKELAEQAISLDPKDIIGYQALANLYFLTNEPDRAIELRRKAIELAPNDAVNLAGTAVRFNEYGMEDEAVELLERAIRLNPEVPWWFF